MKKWTIQVVVWLLSPAIVLNLCGLICLVFGFYCADSFMLWRDGKAPGNPLAKTAATLKLITKGQ
jgi:hypothetical protein